MPTRLDEISLDIDSFLYSLGRFVSTFANTETHIQTVLWHFAGVEAPIAPAVFSGVRINAALGSLKRIADAKKWDKRKTDELKELSQRMGEITQLRNDILHFGATPDWPKGHVVSNRLFAHTEERIRETRVTAARLDAANADLHKIQDHFTVLAWNDIIPEDARSDFVATLRRPWQYKFAPDTATRQTTPGSGTD
ncbi:MAG: hypothetical protein ACTSU0_10020 [Alphaproteobacteria bacterium]